ISFFVFQAEDGIRDRNVTGVQTCALPISLVIVVQEILPKPTKALPITSTPLVKPVSDNLRICVIRLNGFSIVAINPPIIYFKGRSEERRVGKECICRWSPDGETINNRRDW